MSGRTVVIAILVGLGALLLVPLVLMALMMLGMAGMMGCCGPGGLLGPFGTMMGAPWWMLLSGILVALGVLLLLAWGVRTLAADRSPGSEETPLGLLQRRYAAGEIGREEYERVRAQLLADRGNR